MPKFLKGIKDSIKKKGAEFGEAKTGAEMMLLGERWKHYESKLVRMEETRLLLIKGIRDKNVEPELSKKIYSNFLKWMKQKSVHDKEIREELVLIQLRLMKQKYLEKDAKFFENKFQTELAETRQQTFEDAAKHYLGRNWQKKLYKT